MDLLNASQCCSGTLLSAVLHSDDAFLMVLFFCIGSYLKEGVGRGKGRPPSMDRNNSGKLPVPSALAMLCCRYDVFDFLSFFFHLITGRLCKRMDDDGRLGKAL